MERIIIVGSKGCSIHDVWSILSSSETLKDEWPDFARHLQVSTEKIKTFQLDLLRETTSRNGILMEILHVWKSDQGSDATLTDIIRVLEDKCGNNYVGEQLRLAYNLPCKGFQKDSSNWSSLSTAFQEKVEKNLSRFLPNIHIDRDKSKLEGDLLLDLMTGKKPKLFKSTIPHKPAFYFSRIILSKHTISKNVLKADVPDIFLFTGLTEFELGKLVKKYETSTSSEQVNSSELHARFMVLEQRNHSEEISKRTSAPVHLLSYNSRELKWMRTHGRINLLQKFVEDCKNPLSEEQFMACLKDKSSDPVIISDSPGMGKSFLLANIAWELQKLDKTIVVFTSVNDFIKQVKLNVGYGKSTMDSVKDVLQNLICNNELGIAEFQSFISASDIKIELLMDGFDEVSMNDVAQALNIIKVISISFKSVRLWVSTRPHYLEGLETELDVLGYNIQGFDENDQINFLISHWKQSGQNQSENDLDQHKLAVFASKVLQSTKSHLNKDANDIAGIPLQCLLIGETFEKDCIDFASTSNSNPLPTIKNQSISDLYTNTVTYKIKKYVATQLDTELTMDNVIWAHVDLSIALLFPEYNSKLHFTQVNIHDLLKIGIVQERGSTGSTEFIHRTFAEYFVAGYIIELLGEEAENDEFVSFFLDEILMRKKYVLQFLPEMDRITSYKFVHHVIGYFINTNILTVEEPKRKARFLTRKSIEPETKMEIYHACANSSFLQIFKLVFSDYSDINETMILLTIRNSTCEYLKFIFSRFRESIASFEERHLSNFLRVAVQRSDPEIINFFIKSQVFDFRALIENVNDSTKLFLHDCVSNTKYKPNADIGRRVNVIRRLVEINPDLLEAKDSCGRTPLLCEYVHANLLIELIKLGANTLLQDTNGDTVLHLSKNQTRRLDADEYHSLIINIPELMLKQILNIASNDGQLPLTRLISLIDPAEATLAILFQDETESVKVDVFGLAICCERNSKTLENLIKWGVDISWRGSGGKSYLHAASSFGNLDAVKLLVEVHGFNSSIKDDRLLTPMDYAILSKQNKNRYETAKLLCSLGGTASEQVRRNQNNLLEWALKGGNAQSVRIIQEILKFDKHHLTDSEVSRESDGKQRFKFSEETFKSLVNEFVSTTRTVNRDQYERSLIHLAILRGDEVAVKELIENGADLDLKDVNGNTPLHHACFCRDLTIGLRIIKLLIDNGAKAYVKNDDGRTFLHQLFVNGPLQKLNQFHEITEYLAEKNLAKLLLSAPGGQQGSTPLNLACQLLDLEEKTVLLLNENDVSFNQLNTRGQNALICAIIGGRSKTFIDLLVKKGNSDLKQRDLHGNNGLHYAVEHGHVDALKLLIDLGLDVNQVNKYGNTPLHLVANSSTKNMLEIASVLKKVGADVNKVNKDGRSALELILLRKSDEKFDNKIRHKFLKIFEIKNVDVAILKYILNGSKYTSPPPAISMESDGRNQELLLHRAVTDIYNVADCLNVMKSLIPTHSDVCAKDQNDETFLHKFVFSSKASPTSFHNISEYLLDTGHKKLFETKGGKMCATVLHLIVENFEPKLETLQLFKSHKINFNHVDAEGNSLLVYAIRGQRSAEFLALLVNEFEVNWKRLNNLKQNLIHKAALTGNENAVKLFANFGLSVRARDLNKWAPIHFSFGLGGDKILKMLQLLLELGSDVNAMQEYGWTPLHYTAFIKVRSSVFNIVRLLVINGADIFATDCKGYTFLHFLNCKLDFVSKITPKIFHQIAEFLSQRGYYNLFHTPEPEFGISPAMHAVRNLELQKETLCILYSTEGDINQTDNDGHSCLSLAVMGKRSRKLCEELVVLGADINLKNAKGESLLHISSRYNIPEVVSLFIELELDVNGKDNLGQTPIHLAGFRNDSDTAVEIIKCLVEKGADPHALDSEGHSLLNISTRWEVAGAATAIGVLKYLMRNGTNDCGGIDDLHVIMARHGIIKLGMGFSAFELTPLHLAATIQNRNIAVGIIKSLIENGSNPQQIDSYGHNLLHFSAILCAKEVVALFVELGVDVNAENNLGHTPLHFAAYSCDSAIEIAKLLIRNGANVNSTDSYGNTPLHFATMQSSKGLSLVRCFIDNGAKLDSLNFQNTSYIHLAARCGEVDILKFFLRKKVFNVNVVDVDGNTPLHCAILQEDSDYVLEKAQILFECGVDVNIQNKKGQTAFNIVDTRDEWDEEIKTKLKSLLTRLCGISLWRSFRSAWIED